MSTPNSPIASSTGICSDTLNLTYQNVRGLNSKTQSIYNEVCSTMQDYDLVAITETWLNESVFDTEIFPSNFIVHRGKNRSDDQRGGGVLLAIKNTFRTCKIPLEFNDPDIDIIGTKVFINEFSCIYVFVVYITPNCSLILREDLFAMLEGLHVLYDSDFVIIGDFNITRLSDYYNNSEVNDNCVESLINFQNFFDCHQKNRICNINNRILDVVITNLECNVSRSPFSFVSEDVHHPTLTVSVMLKQPKYRELSCNNDDNYNFKKADYTAMYQIFQQLDWGDLELYDNVSSAIDCFYSKVYSTFDVTVPKCRKNKRYPVWFNKTIINILKEKDKLRKKTYKTTNAEIHYKYTQIRTKVKHEIKLAYKDYLIKIQQNMEHDPRSFWKFFGDKKGAVSIPNNMCLGDKIFSTGQSIGHAFSNYFNYVYKKDNDSFVYGDRCTSNNSVLLNSITYEDVCDAVKELKINKSVGPDNIQLCNKGVNRIFC